MKYKLSFRIETVWLFVLLALGIYLMVFAPKEEIASADENRMLAAFPSAAPASIADGEFASGLESFLSDKLPARGKLAQVSQAALDVFSVLTDDEKSDSSRDAFVQGLMGEVTVVSDADAEPLPDAGDTQTDDAQPSVEEGSSQSAISGLTFSPTPVEDFGCDGYTQREGVVERASFADSAYPVLSGSDVPGMLSMYYITDKGEHVEHYEHKPSELDEVAEIYNRIAACLDGGAVNVIIPPEAIFASQYARIKEYVGWKSTIEPYLRSKVSDNVNIYSATDILARAELSDKYLFFGSDHHWTPVGCYYAYREMMLHQGMIPFSWEDHNSQKHQFYGTYYTSPTATPGMQKDTIEIIEPLTASSLYVINGSDQLTPRPFISQDGTSYANTYVYGTVEPWGVIESECNTSRKCMVLYDSFGKPLFPLLSYHYDEQFILDLRSYRPSKGGGQISEIIERFGIDDVYIVTTPIYAFGDYTLTNMKNYI